MSYQFLHNLVGGRRRGETLLEVLIALVVLIIGSATATSLIIMAVRANAYNKDALVALNLAQEGLEYMKNWRDSNWLRFSGDAQHCWNVKPGGTPCGGNLLEEALPAVKGYALGDILGSIQTSPLDLKGGVDDEVYRMNYYDLDAAVDADNSGGPNGKTNDRDFIGSSYGASAAVSNSKFYRSINVDYKTINTATWAQVDTNNAALADMMLVSSTVEWLDGGTVHRVSLSSALTRYK